MVIQCDSREQRWANVRNYLDANGIKWTRSKVVVGDYIRMDNAMLSVDRKRDLQEVAQNLTQQHERFRRECVKAQDLGIRLIVLIEHGRGINNLDDVRAWVNPRLEVSPYAVTGSRLAATMETMARKYGVEWRFCQKQDTGKVIVQILQDADAQAIGCVANE